MKLLVSFIAAALLTNLAAAAPPEKETRFLDALKSAYEKKDQKLFLELNYWERVPEEFKAWELERFEILPRAVRAMRFVPINANNGCTLTYKGVAYGPNTPITKEVEVEFEQGLHSKEILHMPVGEKDGKLLISRPAPQR